MVLGKFPCQHQGVVHWAPYVAGKAPALVLPLITLRKTRIALEFALKVKARRSTSVFWVHAGNAARMEKAYLDIAKKVNISGWNAPDVKPLELVKTWFEAESTSNWILIVDNADDHDLFFGNGEAHKGDSTRRLADSFPRSSNGSILLTTRNKQVGLSFTTARDVLNVEALSLSESEELLAARLAHDSSNVQPYAELANLLERLPLALVQAAAFMSMQSLSVSEYLALYQRGDSSRDQLLCDDFEDDVRDPECKNPVIHTFAISFQQIQLQDRTGARLLAHMSMLDAQAIPRSLLPHNKDPVLFTKAIGTLKAYSLISSSNLTTLQHPDQQFDLHRLVRLAMRSWLRLNGDLEKWTAKTTRSLSNKVYSVKSKYRDGWVAQLPHLLIILSAANTFTRHQSPKPSEEFQDGSSTQALVQAKLRFRVSEYLDQQGKHLLAEKMIRDALEVMTALLGPENLEVLDGLDHQARISRNLYNYNLAEQLSLQVLGIREKIQGKEHYATAKTLMHLGSAVYGLGRYGEAEEIQRHGLDLLRAGLGADDPLILSYLRRLAGTLYKQKQYEAAGKLYREVCREQEKVLGKDHHSTLTSLSELTIVLHKNGEQEEAEDILRSVLAKRLELFGGEHYKICHSMQDLGLVLFAQKRFKEAEEMLCNALDKAGRNRVKELEHPDDLIYIENYAYVLFAQKRYSEAEPLFLRAYEGQRARLGADHHKTQRVLGRYQRAREKLEEPSDSNVGRIRRRFIDCESVATMIHQS